MMKCICYFALFIKVQNCTKYLRTFSAPYSSSYRCARLILNFTNGMTLECANHPFPCSNFHLNQTLPDRNHWSFRIFTEAVILHPTFLEYIMVFFLQGNTTVHVLVHLQQKEGVCVCASFQG